MVEQVLKKLFTAFTEFQTKTLITDLFPCQEPGLLMFTSFPLVKNAGLGGL